MEQKRENIIRKNKILKQKYDYNTNCDSEELY